MGFCQFNNTPSTDMDPGIFSCKHVSTDPSANSQTSVANPSKKGKKHNCIHSKDTRKAYTTSLVCLSNTGLQGQPGSVAKPEGPLGRSVQRLQAGWWMQKQHTSRIRDLPSKLHWSPKYQDRSVLLKLRMVEMNSSEWDKITWAPSGQSSLQDTLGPPYLWLSSISFWIRLAMPCSACFNCCSSFRRSSSKWRWCFVRPFSSLIWS